MNQHSDDLAVDRFAAAMKEKLALARAKGRVGWEQCNPAHLSAMLYKHVEKGDPRDVANFCMFLWSLGQPITPSKAIQAEPFMPVMQFRIEIARLTECLERANSQAEHFEREWYLRGDEIEALKAQQAQAAVAVNEQTLSELKNMVRAYVRLLESGKDRIQSLGGDCDPVDRMEAGDSNLRTAKAAIAAAEAAKGGV